MAQEAMTEGWGDLARCWRRLCGGRELAGIFGSYTNYEMMEEGIICGGFGENHK